MRTKDLKSLMRALQREPTLPKYQAGRVFGWGRRATDQAIRDGQLKVIDGPKQVVATAWIRRQLQIEPDAYVASRPAEGPAAHGVAKLKR
jgi:hypothetical protein